jgi:hypothetical protein
MLRIAMPPLVALAIPPLVARAHKQSIAHPD